MAGVTIVWDDAAAAAPAMLAAAATGVLSMEEEAVGPTFVLDKAEPNAAHTGGVLLLLLCGVAFATTASLPSVRIEEFGGAAASIGGLNDVYKLD